MPETLTHYLPWAAIVVGLVVLAWGQKDRLAGLFARPSPAPGPAGTLSPSERFEKFIALRAWCEEAGQAEAVKSLDSVVLPALVQRGKA